MKFISSLQHFQTIKKQKQIPGDLTVKSLPIKKCIYFVFSHYTRNNRAQLRLGGASISIIWLRFAQFRSISGKSGKQSAFN